MKSTSKLISIILAVSMLLFLTLPAAASEDAASENVDAVYMFEEGDAALTNAPVLSVSAPSAILVEQSTGKVIFEKNPDQPMPPASVTKIMTMLLIIEALESGRISLSDMVRTSTYAAGMGGSQIYLEAGEEMSVSDMLKAIAVASANDACVAMGEFIAGSNEAFIAMMNSRAKSLGMTNTQFINAHGLDADGHYTTARDIATMSCELLKHDEIREYVTIWMDELRGGETQISNTNKMLRTYSGATGLKTGSTGKAKFCMSATAYRDGMELIAVVLGGDSSALRFEDAAKMLDYGFATHTVIDSPNVLLSPIRVIGGVQKEAALTLSGGDVRVVVTKGMGAKITATVEMQDDIMAPVDLGQKVGVVNFFLDGERIASRNIVTAVSVEKMGLFGYFTKNLRCYLLAE